MAAEWGSIVIRVFGDKSGLDCVGKEPGLYVLNHPGDTDFLCGVVLAYEFNILTVSYVCIVHLMCVCTLMHLCLTIITLISLYLADHIKFIQVVCFSLQIISPPILLIYSLTAGPVFVD